MAKAKMKWFHWVLVALAAIVGMGAVSGLANKDEKKLNAFDYEQATIEGGKVSEGEGTLVSDYFSVNEMTVDIKDDAKVTYQIHFFDEDKKYVSSTEEVSEDFKYEATEGSTIVYARIEITPTDDEDGEISFFEKIEYARQIEVTYNPELLEV